MLRLLFVCLLPAILFAYDPCRVHHGNEIGCNISPYCNYIVETRHCDPKYNCRDLPQSECDAVWGDACVFRDGNCIVGYAVDPCGYHSNNVINCNNHIRCQWYMYSWVGACIYRSEAGDFGKTNECVTEKDSGSRCGKLWYEGRVVNAGCDSGRYCNSAFYCTDSSYESRYFEYGDGRCVKDGPPPEEEPENPWDRPLPERFYIDYEKIGTYTDCGEALAETKVKPWYFNEECEEFCVPYKYAAKYWDADMCRCYNDCSNPKKIREYNAVYYINKHGPKSTKREHNPYGDLDLEEYEKMKVRVEDTIRELPDAPPEPETPPPVKQCERPNKFCSHDGAIYLQIDCDGDGFKDPYCEDSQGNIGVILSSKYCTVDWPNGVCKSTSCQVKLTKQLSSTKCISGKTYGCVDATTMYAEGGCRGQFTVQGQSLKCESHDRKYTACRMTKDSCQVKLVKQLSRTKCISDKTYGCVDSTTMYTDGGCRGKFTVQGQSLKCESNGSKYAACQISTKECKYNYDTNWRGVRGSEDLPNMPLQSHSYKECAQLCWENPDCEYFVHDDNRNYCFLKKNFSYTKSASGLTSGWRCNPGEAGVGGSDAHLQSDGTNRWLISGFMIGFFAGYVHRKHQDSIKKQIEETESLL